MKSKLIPLLLIVLVASSCSLLFGQVAQKSNQINWMTFEEVEKAQETEKRKVIVDIYTDWCGWCKQMDKTTFKQENVVDYINENYYAIKFNAEQKEDITLNGETYEFVKSGKKGYHELAAAIMKNRMSYPTTVFLNDNFSLIQPIPGYLDANKLEAIMNYFADDEHKKTPWTRYEKTYIPAAERKPLKVKKEVRTSKKVMTAEDQ